MGLEKCSKCDGMHYRNAPCPPALLAKKAASAAAPSHRLGPQDQSGELPSASKGRASSKKGAATKTTKKRGGSSAVEPLTSNQTVEGSTPSRRSSSLDLSHSDPEVKHGKGAGRSSSVILAKAEAAAAHLAPKRGRGRPKSIRDMAAYKAEKQREYRARLKAEREGK